MPTPPAIAHKIRSADHRCRFKATENQPDTRTEPPPHPALSPEGEKVKLPRMRPRFSGSVSRTYFSSPRLRSQTRKHNLNLPFFVIEICKRPVKLRPS